MECAGKAALEFSGAMSATASTPRSRSLSEYTGSGPRSSRDSARTEHRRSAKSTVNLTSLFDLTPRRALPVQRAALCAPDRGKCLDGCRYARGDTRSLQFRGDLVAQRLWRVCDDAIGGC